MLVPIPVVEVTATLLWNCSGCGTYGKIIFHWTFNRKNRSCSSCCNTVVGNCWKLCYWSKKYILRIPCRNTTSSGCCNVAIGYDVELPNTTGNDQMVLVWN